MLVLRILFGLAVIAFGVWALRRAWRSRPQLSAETVSSPGAEERAISGSELRALEKMGRSMPLLAEALSLRPKILEIAKDGRIALTAETLIREVARELENERRIAEALAEIDDSKLNAQLEEADDRINAAFEDPEARRLAEGTVERLVAMRDARNKLRRRAEEIRTRVKHMVLELRTAQLALLEATAGASLETIEEIRARLRQASEEARRAAVAEEEVARLIARGIAGREG